MISRSPTLQGVASCEVCKKIPVVRRVLSLRHLYNMIPETTMPLDLKGYHTFSLRQKCSNTPSHAGYCTVTVLSAVPPLALVAVDGWELRGKNLACMHSLMGTVGCSFVLAARPEFAAVASTAVVAVVGVVHRFAVVGANLGDSVPEMVPRHSCCDLLAVVDAIEEGRSAVGFGCNTLQLNLPSQAFEGAVPWVMVGIAGGFGTD